MSYQSIFKRYEFKYMITAEQKERVLQAISPYMNLDNYGRTEIRNIYFDTDSYLLIRRSIEKPVYKEKLRIRSYGKAAPSTDVFVELKRKYNRLVYKRRVSLAEKQAMEWICESEKCQNAGQINREIEYFLSLYENLHPTVFLSYERESYFTKQKSDFRVTFDDNILCRCDDLSLESEAYGTALLPEGTVLMEIKCSGGIPLWMTRILSDERIYKTSFSKYGTAYKKIIFPKLQEVNL